MNVREYYMNRYAAPDAVIDVNDYPDSSKIPVIDLDSVKIMFPVNPETGQVVDLLTRLMQTDNELERNQIMQLLQDNGSDSVFNNLDDATKLQLLKPRSVQSLAEMDAYFHVVEQALNEFNSSHDEDPASGSASDPGSDPAPDSAPAVSGQDT